MLVFKSAILLGQVVYQNHKQGSGKYSYEGLMAFNSCTKCLGSPGIIQDRTPICHPFSGHGRMYDLTTARNTDSHATWVIGVLGLFLDMLSMGVCTTTHWQTSGRLVQKLNACTASK